MSGDIGNFWGTLMRGMINEKGGQRTRSLSVQREDRKEERESCGWNIPRKEK